MEQKNLLVVAVCALVAGCGDSPPGRTYYQRNIEPILVQKCAGNTSGCHSTNSDDPFKFAAGNLDVTSFENVQKRRDALAPFGAYPYPLLLIKAVGPGVLQMYYGDKFRPIDVQHSGGAILDPSSDAFFTLQSWLENGATANGLKPATPAQEGTGVCSTAIPPGFDRTKFVTGATQASFDAFKTNVQPIFTNHGCNAGSCHGAPQSDFYITCGADDNQLAFNFSQAWSFVNNPVEDSQILKVPLAAGSGGRGHTGGDQFSGTGDPDYTALKTWASQAGKLDFANGDAGKQFFADNVQPILLQRGCSFMACHSPAATNDFKLRSGTQGFFSAIALEKNYELLKDEFVAIEFPDARRGRAIAKAVLENDPSIAGVAGIEHRGGPVLDTQGKPSDPAACGAFNPATSTTFCTIQAWLDLERGALLAAGQVTNMAPGQTIKVVYIERPAGSANADRLAFDTFSGGAELRVGTSTIGAGGALGTIDAAADSQALDLTGCGLNAGADIQAPDVANDGTRIAFAGRNSAAEPLGVFVINVDGSQCTRITPAAGDSNGLKVHNFDPAFSPDGNWVVFASTRGKTGATKSRKRFLPQSDIWRLKVAGVTADQASLEQVTFLSNSEVSPQFMREGRITMTTEKANGDGFYQLSGRRINWDRTDYHPLLAQRATSLYSDMNDLTQTKPSVGYAAATDIREGSDGSFLLILSDLKADGSPVSPGGGGALGVFNRSIGPFEQGRNDVAFIPALRFLNQAGATGHAGSPASYRAPVTLPSGEIMVSYASTASQANFDIVAISPRDGAQRALFTNGGGKLRVDAVLAYKYPARPLYDNRRQLVFGGSAGGDPGHAIVHMPDAPMVFTLLTGNLRRGRPVEAFRKARYLAVYAEGMCPAGNCSATSNGVFESRQMLGSPAKLADDGSVKIQLPSETGVVFELQDGNHNSIVKMGEEHQLGPGESISMGISEKLFDAVCGGCHGSVSGHELDVGVTPDALTGASKSTSSTEDPFVIGN